MYLYECPLVLLGDEKGDGDRGKACAERAESAWDFDFFWLELLSSSGEEEGAWH